MSKPANFFKSLTDVPVHYDRPPLAPYGSLGVEYDFHTTVNFENFLEECFAEVWNVCALGKGKIIISAGAFVDKPNSYHNSGQAFDLDGIHWEGKSFVCLNYPSDRRFYLGIEAVLRKHFNTVRDYNYNPAHRDHLHVDIGGIIEFRKNMKSKVFFLQAALSHVLEIPVKIDGDWGTETSDATHQGRGGVQAIKDALSSGANNEAKYKNLLKIGYPKWKDRIDPLRDTIAAMVQQGKLEKMRYSKAQNDFVSL